MLHSRAARGLFVSEPQRDARPIELAFDIPATPAGQIPGAAGMIEAGRQFRRVNGHLHLPKLRAALKACFAENVTAACQDETVRAA